MKKLFFASSLIVISLLFIAPAYANHIIGYVYCDVNANGVIDSSDTPLIGVKLTATGTAGTASATTGSDGYYEIIFPGGVATYTVVIDPSTLPANSIIILPASNIVNFDGIVGTIELDWLISSPTCQAGACWLTAGGVKFDSILGIKAAEFGPKFNFGGNTFPGCSPTAGDGGQWNFVDRAQKIHFQGWVIDQVRCGNVSGIPPGSESPVTPFNFIDFSGTGTIKGISGNKGPFAPSYYFVVHAEDRNEPGNEKALLPDGGSLVDRLFLRVYTNPLAPISSTTYLICAGNCDQLIGDPVTITGGNLQLHISSCP